MHASLKPRAYYQKKSKWSAFVKVCISYRMRTFNKLQASSLNEISFNQTLYKHLNKSVYFSTSSILTCKGVYSYPILLYAQQTIWQLVIQEKYSEISCISHMLIFVWSLPGLISNTTIMTSFLCAGCTSFCLGSSFSFMGMFYLSPRT